MVKRILLALVASLATLHAAQYDMVYIQQDSAGDNQERLVTLTPSTFLSVSANGTLQVQSTADFLTSLGLATVATTGNYSDLSGKPTLFSGNYSDLSGAPTTWPWSGITGKPTTLSGYGISDAMGLNDGLRKVGGNTLTSPLTITGNLSALTAFTINNTATNTGSGEPVTLAINVGSGGRAIVATSDWYAVHGIGMGAGTGISGTSGTSNAVYGLSTSGIAVSAVSFGAEAIKAQTYSGSANIAEYWQGGVLKSAIANTGSFVGPSITLTGNITMSGNRTLALAGNSTLNGTFSGTSSGNNTGDQDLSGYATLAGNNTFSGTNTFTGNVSLTLAETVTFQRVNIGSEDYGWQYNPAGGGQLEFVFPGGTAAFYQTGSPAIPYMYFPGTVQADYLVGAIDGVTINADGLSGTIPIGVTESSLTNSLSSFLATQNNAGASGIPYLDGGVSIGFHPTPADTRYYMTVYVVNGSGSANYLEGQYRSPAHFSADTHPSATASLDFPSIAAGGSQSLTITVSGAVTTNTPTVQLGWSAALPAGVVVSHARVSAANTVTITLSNITASAIDPAAVTCRASITQY